MRYKSFVEHWKKNKQKLLKNYVYDELDEHSSCGVGLIASLNGNSTREVVEMGIQALKVLYHRGAVDADGKTGDGAGICFNIPKIRNFKLINVFLRETSKGHRYWSL